MLTTPQQYNTIAVVHYILGRPLKTFITVVHFRASVNYATIFNWIYEAILIHTIKVSSSSDDGTDEDEEFITNEEKAARKETKGKTVVEEKCSLKARNDTFWKRYFGSTQRKAPPLAMVVPDLTFKQNTNYLVIKHFPWR